MDLLFHFAYHQKMKKLHSKSNINQIMIFFSNLQKIGQYICIPTI